MVIWRYVTCILWNICFLRGKGLVNLIIHPSDLLAANVQTRWKACAEVNMTRLRVICGKSTG
jgi:hypothetical protein